ncbi:putative transporter protein smf2 protein [Lasiodiplodia theobromae]|uniref:Manganese transporter SMF1 n=1 Tax=Lasiodiplodia theobromae TaxID=45133 RepID=A0A5N5DAL6_9PEZI|nr:Transporter protein smf2 [Lasiodiplodia theobromae]KAB2574214.1 Manganese transporter SMF1 [Lasiodiplodia theobromae]KAF4543129.1 Transporter protein smf2 [Lasiodiplodia theobromae]KAF9635703.1 putative transporter protein smf2 protein [Lasiodiplodia theobromae]
MNCPSRVEPEIPPGWNQNPPALNADATTCNDLNHIANERQKRKSSDRSADDGAIERPQQPPDDHPGPSQRRGFGRSQPERPAKADMNVDVAESVSASRPHATTFNVGYSGRGSGGASWFSDLVFQTKDVLYKYAKFVGPGFMVAVAYIDPGNYATDVAAGASYRFKLLFIILMSNIFAIFLQSLCVKLGTVTGMNLAENCRAHLPWWLNIVLYIFAESAIIATDIAEVIGTAISLNVLLNVPLVAGCAISIVDVFIILLFYRPSGSMRAVRIFEYFVMLLVLGVVVCFCFQLSLIKHTSVGDVFRGYLPSKAIVESKGLYQACGILGATVMPHSLYLGSGIIQPRLREFDEALSASAQNPAAAENNNSDSDSESIMSLSKYRPSIQAIKACYMYSVVETAISLFTFALFVNSAILIVAGASLYNTPGADSADLFGIHDLLSSTLAPAAGTIFALALLLSGISAGIVCTIAGQMISEGQLNWSCKPWKRRFITRSISITPSIIVAGAVGREGLSDALEGSQVALSVILPFVSAPLVYFTCRNKFMTVSAIDRGVPPNNNTVAQAEHGERRSSGSVEEIQMRNSWLTATIALLIWLVIVIMNIALLVLVGMDKA